jgi:hypothetical protein
MPLSPERHPTPPVQRLWHRLRAYIAHDDPATATANFIAVMVGWNTPFYPIYVLAFAGWDSLPAALLTGLAAPLFLAVPAIARTHPSAARFALPFISTANMLWCTKVLGPSCGLELFLMPCVMLAGLLYRRPEKPWLMIATSFALAAYALPSVLPSGPLGTPILLLPAEAARRLAALNEGSALTLVLVIAWQTAALLRMRE